MTVWAMTKPNARARDEFLQQAADQYARAPRRHSRHAQGKLRAIATTRQPARRSGRCLRRRLQPRFGWRWKQACRRQPAVPGNRRSVDAQYVALRRQLLGGFSADLDRAGLLKVFASKQLEEQWTDELFELNREAYGKPGITKNAQALEIAKIIRKWQKQSMAMLNREGAWIRSYSGYVTRSSHDPTDRQGRHGQVGDETSNEWISSAPSARQTSQVALDALRQMGADAPGEHSTTESRLRSRFTPTWPSGPRPPANCTSSQARTGGAYNQDYGVHNPTTTIVQSLSTRAPNRADEGVRHQAGRDLRARHRIRDGSDPGRGEPVPVSVLAAMESGRTANPKARRTCKEKIDALKAEIDKAPDELSDFNTMEQPLRNRFAQIDGSSMKPVNKTQSKCCRTGCDPAHGQARPRSNDPLCFAADQGRRSALLGHSVRRAVRFAVPPVDQRRRGRQAPSARQTWSRSKIASAT